MAKRDAKERKHYQERVLREEECIEEAQRGKELQEAQEKNTTQ